MRSRDRTPLHDDRSGVHRRLLRTVAAVVAAIAAAGCSSAPSDDAADGSASDDGDAGCQLAFCPTDARSDALLAVQVKGIIDHVCDNNECHGLGGPAVADLAFSVGNEFTSIVGVVSHENAPMLRVKPFDPENSYVYLKPRVRAEQNRRRLHAAQRANERRLREHLSRLDRSGRADGLVQRRLSLSRRLVRIVSASPSTRSRLRCIRSRLQCIWSRQLCIRSRLQCIWSRQQCIPSRQLCIPSRQQCIRVSPRGDPAGPGASLTF